MNNIAKYDLNNVPYVVVINSIISAVSRNFLEITEFNEEDFVGKGIGEAFSQLRININGAGSSSYLFTKSLSVFEVEISTLHAASSGESIYIFTEKPHSRLDRKLTHIYQLCKDNLLGISLYSLPDYTLLMASQKYLDFLDQPFKCRENSLGKSVFELIPGFKGSKIEAISMEVINSGKSAEVKEHINTEFMRGATYWNSILTPITEEGKTKYFSTIAIDVTEKVTYKKELEEKNIQLHTIINNISDSVLVVNNKGEYFIKNKAFRSCFENAEIEKIGDGIALTKIYDIEGKELSLRELPASFLMNGEIVRNKEYNLEFGGNRKSFLFSGIPVYDSDGNFSMGVLTGTDITEMKESKRLVEEQNKALEKAMVMKDDFLTLVSHEFKTPLTVINSAIQALEMICWKDLPDNAKGLIKKIEQGTYRQLRLVNNLIDIAQANAEKIRIERKNADIIAITKAIVESVCLYTEQKEIELTFCADDLKKIIALDEEKYERILLNLLSNSIKFTPRNKTIRVMIQSEGDEVVLSIEDTGIGIPQDKLDFIFERFGQVDNSLKRSAEGSGIGLALVKYFAEAMGGNVTVKSELGKGSTFKVFLPAYVLPDDMETKKIHELSADNFSKALSIEFSDIYL